MIIVLFHVLYLLGRFVYKRYRVNRGKDDDDHDRGEAIEDTSGSETIYGMRDAETRPAEPTIKFFPPAYVQRYVAVSNLLNDAKHRGTLRKIVDFGCSELGFLTYMKNTEGVEEILCVDIDRQLLEAYKERAAPLVCEFLCRRSTPLKIEICEGSVTHNDKKLEKTDAVVCIELIEHLYPDTLTELPSNIFGYVKPKLAIFTTPNAEFNVLFPNFTGFRHPDHKFEWTREQFQDWAKNIVTQYPDYEVTFDGICNGPTGTEHLGACSQMAVFTRTSKKDICIPGVEGLFKTVEVYDYPFSVDNRSDEQKILDEAAYHIRKLSFSQSDMLEEIPLMALLEILDSFCITMDGLKTILAEAGWAIVDRDLGPVVLVPPVSTSSSYSAMEEGLIGDAYSANDDEDLDDWNREPGPPATEYADLQLEEPGYEDWRDEVWEEEPSIVIPQNHTMPQENTYLYDGGSMSLDHDQILQEAQYYDAAEDDVEGPYDTCEPADRLNYTEDTASSSEFSSSSRGNLSFSDVVSHSDLLHKPLPSTAQRLYQTLDFQAYMSTTRASTSPDAFLLETVKLDRLMKDHSISNQSTSDCWMLNSTLQHSDLSRGVSISSRASNVDDQQTHNRSSVKEHLPDGDSSCSISRNLPHDDESLSNSRETSISRCSSVENVQSTQCSSPSVQETSNKRDDLSDVENKLSHKDNNTRVSETLPQFTSTPKLAAKCNTSGKKRKSLTYNSQSNEKDVSNDVETKGDVSVGSLESTSLSLYSSTVGGSSSFVSRDSTAQTTSSFSTTSNSHTNTSVSSNSNIEEKTDHSNSLTDTQKSEFSTTASESIETGKTRSFSSGSITETKSSVCESSSTCHATNGSTDFSTSSSNLRTTHSSCNSEKQAKDIDQAGTVLNNEEQCECVDQKSEPSNPVEVVGNTEMKLPLLENLETPPNSWSPEVIDSGYPNSASAQDMSPEYDLSSISQDHLSDSESASVAEAPRLGVLEPVEVENGDLANNNRDGEGNNMVALVMDQFDNLLINVLENDLENDNDIYAVENGFPLWLLRILEMPNPIEMDGGHVHRNPLPDDLPEGNARYGNADNDEGFDNSSSEDESDLDNNDMRQDDEDDVNENVILGNMENENASNSDCGSD